MRHKVLENLAIEEVGKPGSPLIFVTVGGNVRAVFVGKKHLEDAIDYAQGLQDNYSIVVEDAHGVVWESD